MMYNLQLYFVKWGSTKTLSVRQKNAKTFYHSFFRHGIIKSTRQSNFADGFFWLFFLNIQLKV